MEGIEPQMDTDGHRWGRILEGLPAGWLCLGVARRSRRFSQIFLEGPAGWLCWEGRTTNRHEWEGMGRELNHRWGWVLEGLPAGWFCWELPADLTDLRRFFWRGLAAGCAWEGRVRLLGVRRDLRFATRGTTDGH